MQQLIYVVSLLEAERFGNVTKMKAKYDIFDSFILLPKIGVIYYLDRITCVTIQMLILR